LQERLVVARGVGLAENGLLVRRQQPDGVGKVQDDTVRPFVEVRADQRGPVRVERGAMLARYHAVVPRGRGTREPAEERSGQEDES
jgi:hypothetical protein